MNGRVIGIDPGLTGGVAFVSDDGFNVVDMPVCDSAVDAYALTVLLVEAGPCDVVAVEAVHAMPTNGSIACFKLGQGYGTILGVLAALERPVIHVPPTRWVGDLRLPKGGKSAADKRAAKNARRRRAMDTWPADAALFARVKDDGRADAALIAWWAANMRDGIRRAS